MKFLLKAGVPIIFLFLLLQSFMVMPAEKTDERKYKVVYTDNELEIRFYQAATLATYYSDAVSYWDVALPAFKTLAGYIFGKNETDA